MKFDPKVLQVAICCALASANVGLVRVAAFTPNLQSPKTMKGTSLGVSIGLGPEAEGKEEAEAEAVAEVVAEIEEPDHELFRKSRLSDFDDKCDEWFHLLMEGKDEYLGPVSEDAKSKIMSPVELKRPPVLQLDDEEWTPYQSNILPGSPILPSYGLETYGLPIPRRNAEVWRHFDLNGLISTDYSTSPCGIGTNLDVDDDIIVENYVKILKDKNVWLEDEDCAGRLVYIDGRFVPELSFETEIANNLGPGDIPTDDDDLIQKMTRLPDGFTDRLAADVPSGETDSLTSFKKLSGPDHNVGEPTSQFAINGQQGTACFVALNSLKAGAVAYVNVPECKASSESEESDDEKNMKQEEGVGCKPVIVINAITAKGGLTEGAPEGENKGVASHPRTLVVAGDNSRLSIIQSFVDLGETNTDDSVQKFVNSCTQMYIGSNANVTHSYIEEFGGTVTPGVEQESSDVKDGEESPKEIESQRKELRNTFFEAVDVHVTGDDGYYDGAYLSTGGNGRSRISVSTSLLRPGAHAGISGFALSGGAQRTDFRTLIHHIAQGTSSRQVQKNMLGGRATTTFRGRIRVEQSAQQTDSEQLARTILLSDNSRIWTIPSLEIIADDVTCTHGATVSDLAEEELFYLRSRGIDRTNARNIMMYAFADDVSRRVDKVMQGDPDDPRCLKNRIIKKLENLVPQGERAIKGDFQSV